jgi:drug/metabolite transporter (DMT)-like permease
MILLGIAAGALAGFSFAVLTVGVRKAVTSDTSPVTVVFMVNLMGVVVLGPWCMHQPGLDALLQTAPRDLAVMLAAGALNLIAFLLVTRSLQSISVVLFNVLNNGLTAALTAVMGIALLSEPYNGTLLLGILLSTAGIIVISLVAPDPQPEQEPSHIL